MELIDIVRVWLIEKGYDGLCNSEDWDGCGCTIDDLMPCGEPGMRCMPAYKIPMADVPSGFDYWMSPTK